MILRKPYAILIKYFKSIHIAMFIMFAYLVFALRKIYIFFSNYIQTGTYVYRENMASIYVPWFMFLIVILLLIFSISILSLMRKKEKPVLFYKIMIGYTSLLLIALIYFVVFFNSLDKTIYETLRIVINRDISLAVYLFNFFFVAFSFIRGFGFDIKKFSFDKDKKELNLEESDNEEYELNVGLEKADVRSFLNKQKREMGYYFRENKLILSIIFVIIAVFVGFSVYYNFFVENKIYKESENIHVGGMNFTVLNSLVSERDKYGQVINPNDDYLIVNMNIINDSSEGVLDPQTFRVHILDNYYYPLISSCESFSDLGECYKNQTLKANENKNYIIVYRIPKEHNEIYLEILKNKREEYDYNKVLLSYKKEEINDVTENEFEIKGNKYSISNYKISNKEEYKYQECIQEECSDFKKIVKPDTGGMVLTLEINDLDKIDEEILNSSFGVKYHDIIYSGKDVRLLAKNNNYVYYSIPGFINGNAQFTLLVNTRGLRYNILLGGE